jgi:hypothetical protein
MHIQAHIRTLHVLRTHTHYVSYTRAHTCTHLTNTRLYTHLRCTYAYANTFCNAPASILVPTIQVSIMYNRIAQTITLTCYATDANLPCRILFVRNLPFQISSDDM